MKKTILIIMCLFAFSISANAKSYKEDELYFTVPDNWKLDSSTNVNGTIEYNFTDYNETSAQKLIVKKQTISECEKFIFSNGVVRERFQLSLDVDVDPKNISNIFFEKFSYDRIVQNATYKTVNYVTANNCNFYQFTYYYQGNNTKEAEFESIVASLRFKRFQLAVDDKGIALIQAVRVGFALLGILIIIVTSMYIVLLFQHKKELSKK